MRLGRKLAESNPNCIISEVSAIVTLPSLESICKKHPEKRLNYALKQHKLTETKKTEKEMRIKLRNFYKTDW